MKNVGHTAKAAPRQPLMLVPPAWHQWLPVDCSNVGRQLILKKLVIRETKEG
jgi:hypothetical protein